MAKDRDSFCSLLRHRLFWLLTTGGASVNTVASMLVCMETLRLRECLVPFPSVEATRQSPQSDQKAPPFTRWAGLVCECKSPAEGSTDHAAGFPSP